MKERPIPYSAPMVRARREERKTHTRRGLRVRPTDLHEASNFLHGRSVEVAMGKSIGEFREQDGMHFGLSGYTTVVSLKCPYGVPGDRLWVREAWRAPKEFDDRPPRDIPAGTPVWYEADGAAPAEYGRYRHAKFMPRWVSRSLDEVVAVRVERLQDISEADCIAEGVQIPVDAESKAPLFRISGKFAPANYIDHAPRTSWDWYRTHYASLFESINGPGSWDANPWVWVIEFKRVTQ